MNRHRLPEKVLRRALPPDWGWLGAGGKAIESSLVWMLGSPRSGSTWLLNLLRIAPGAIAVDEPAIGSHLGVFGADVMGVHPTGFDEAEMLLTEQRRDDERYFFDDADRSVWAPALRRLLLARFDAYIQRLGGTPPPADPVVVIKEPAGSQAAELLSSVLPSSRLLFLMRDGRDVIDSELDAVGKGGWLAELFGSDEVVAGTQRLNLVQSQAHIWVARTEAVWRAYEGHDPHRRHLVRYEDLLIDPYKELSTILQWLRRPVDGSALRAHVDRLSFEALPSDRKGKGRFARAATPGLWRKNLSSDEQAIVNEIMSATLSRFGYDVPATG